METEILKEEVLFSKTFLLAVRELNENPFSKIQFLVEGNTFFLTEKSVNVIVKQQKFTYNELFMLNTEEKEVFNREVEILNDLMLYDLYKKQNDLVETMTLWKLIHTNKLTLKNFYLFISASDEMKEFLQKFIVGAIQTEEQNVVILEIIEQLKKRSKSLEIITYSEESYYKVENDGFLKRVREGRKIEREEDINEHFETSEQ